MAAILSRGRWVNIRFWVFRFRSWVITWGYSMGVYYIPQEIVGWNYNFVAYHINYTVTEEILRFTNMLPYHIKEKVDTLQLSWFKNNWGKLIYNLTFQVTQQSSLNVIWIKQLKHCAHIREFNIIDDDDSHIRRHMKSISYNVSTTIMNTNSMCDATNVVPGICLVVLKPKKRLLFINQLNETLQFSRPS